jgi:hypothetical protein
VIGPNTSTPIIFAGATEDAGFFAPGGVYRSTNNGTNWNPIGLADSSIVMLGVSGSTLFAQTSYDFLRSTDDGVTWTPANNGLANLFVSAIAVTDTNSPAPLIFAATFSGIFRSSDNGTSWEKASYGLADTSIVSLAVCGPNLFAGTNNSGVYISTDNGTNWSPANGGTSGIGANRIDNFAVSGTNIFAVSAYVFYNAQTSPGKVFLSTNNGVNWTVVGDTTDFAFYGPLIVCGSYLFAGSGEGGAVLRRPLSQMINANGVSSPFSSNNSLTSYPNPFSQSTTISFTTPESSVATVAIVNILGATVARIFSGELDAGAHTFTWDAQGLPAGMYECIVQMNGKVERTAMVVN